MAFVGTVVGKYDPDGSGGWSGLEDFQVLTLVPDPRRNVEASVLLRRY